MKEKIGITMMKSISNLKIAVDNDSKDKSYVPKITPPMIDKLSAVIDIPEPELCGVALHGLISWVKEDKQIGVSRIKAHPKYQFAVNMKYPTHGTLITNHSPFIRLEITPTKAKQCQLRLEYNPAYMTADGEAYLDVMIQSLLGVTFYELLYHARFTRADVCRDIDAHIENFLIRMKWAKKVNVIFNAEGKLETLKLGESGAVTLNAYNKAEQLKAKQPEQAIKGERTRIEARCKGNHTPDKLVELKNPFQRVELYSVYCSNPPLGEAHWKGFIDSCLLRGVGNAIKNQPQECRYKLKKILSEQPVTWWVLSDDEWLKLWKDALSQAGLDKIPAYAPPLTMDH